MKIPRTRFLLVMVFLTAAALLRGQTTLFWPNSATTGTWDTSTIAWGTATGLPASVAWTNGDNATITTTTNLTGTITVAAGGVSLVNLADSSSGASSWTINGGTLTLADGTNAAVNASWNIRGGTGTTFTVASVIADPTTGSSGLTLASTSTRTLVLTGNNTYTGGTTVSAGTLQLGNGGTSGAVAGNIANTGTLIFNRSDNYTYGGVISGTGAWSQAASTSSVLTLTGNNTSTGTATINAGSTLQIGNGGTTGAAAGNLVDKSAVIFNRSDTVTYAGVISSTGTVTQTGGGTLILTGANTYSGGTTINAGSTLQIGNGGATGSLSATGPVTDNGALVFNNTATVTNGSISGTGSLTQAGVGTVILSGTNTFSGGTTISAGTLQIGNGGTTGSVAGDITDNSILVFNRTNSSTYSGIISGTGSMTQAGAGGSLILAGANTYGGGTTVASGSTLQIGNGGTSGSVLGNIANAGTLDFNRTDDTAFGGVISGVGSMIKDGLNTLILGGANTMTGITTINAGRLQVDGSLASATVNVGSGGALAGRGTLAGNVNVNAGGALAAGSSGTPRALGITGSLTLAATSSTLLNINGPAAGVTYDAFNVGGVFTAGGDLTLNFGAAPASATYHLVNYASALGDFNSVSVTGVYGASLTSLGAGHWSSTGGGNTYDLQLGGTGLSLTVASVIPEPSTYALLAGLLAASGALVRRRRRAAA
jgi:autotransporter-associated beta strand protein